MEHTLKVQILNYQRIKKASLEFIPGLNVIVGKTNQGKSACIRALETCIFNLPREGHVTLGETKSAVGVKYQGHEVIWRRDTQSSSQVTYRVDGKIYSKVGRGQPEVVKEAFHISEIDVNGKKYRVNFSKQLSYPFLLDVTSSELFKFIVQTSEEDNVIGVLDTMKSDLTQMSANVKKYDEAREELSKAYSRELARYKDKEQYLSVCDQVLSLEPLVKQYQDLSASIETYSKDQFFIESSQTSLNSLKKNLEVLDSAISLLESTSENYTGIGQILQTYGQAQSDKLLSEQRLLVLSSQYETYSELDTYLQVLQSLQGKQSSLELLDIFLSSYSEQDLIRRVSKEHLEQLCFSQDSYTMVVETVERLLQDLDYKKETIERLTLLLRGLDQVRQEIEHSQLEMESLKQEVQQTVEEIDSIGCCPYCGSVLGVEHNH